MKKTDKKDAEQIENPEAQTVADELETQITLLNEALLRERADSENVRRRAEEEKIKLGSFYKALVVKQLITVIDNFEQAMRLESKDVDYKKGIDAIYRQFGDVLQKLDVQRVKTVGEPFDPHTMEAVSAEEGDGDQEIVSEELQSGYTLNDELLRPAMVRVKS